MAKIGSQKLYNTARQGNGPLLQFMLSCPENLSPWNEGKLKEAINASGDKKENMLLCVARLPIKIGTWARETLENVILGQYDYNTDQRVMRERVDKMFRLYIEEMPQASLINHEALLTYASLLGDWEGFGTTLQLVARHHYDPSREDDMAAAMFNAHSERQWGNRTPKNPALAKESVQCVIEWGTQFGLTDAYRPMVNKMVLTWDMPDMAAFCFAQRPDADLFDSTQRTIFNLLSADVRARLINPNFKGSTDE